MSQHVRLEVEGGIGTIRIDRPPMNALDSTIQAGLAAAAAEATERRDVSAVVVYGGEKVFAAGADIKEMQGLAYTDMVDRGRALQSSFTAIAAIPKPTVAAITGLRARRRLRARALLRLPGLRRRRQARPARDPARHHPGRRRHPAAAAARRPVEGQGPDLLRPLRGRRRGARDRPGRQGGRAGRRVLGCARAGLALRRRTRLRAARREGGDRQRAGGRPHDRSGDRAGGVRRRCSPPRTVRSAWSRSCRTAPARRSSPAADVDEQQPVTADQVAKAYEDDREAVRRLSAP